MSALPNITFPGPWLSLGVFTDEEMATLELPPAALVGSADHSPSTTCTITPPGSVSSDATAINTPQSGQSGQSPSTSSAGLRRAAIDSSSHGESTQPEQQECFSNNDSPDRYHVFSGSSEMASVNMGRAGVVDLVPDLARGHLNSQLAEASNTTSQSGHGYSGLLADDLLQSLFSDGTNSEVPSAQLGCFINDTNATCSAHLLHSGAEGEQYQHCVSQAPAPSWEEIGGLVSYGQTRNHYADDFSSNRWYGNGLHDPVYQFTPHLPTSCPFHIPDESPLTIDPALNAELSYDPMDEKGMIQKIPSNSPSAQDSIMSAFEDVQPQPESAPQSLVVGALSGPTRTKVNLQNPHRVRHKHGGESGLLPQKQRLKHRRAFTDLSQRLETGETRRRGACLRCRMQRIRCYADPNDVHGPCSTCQGVFGPTQAQLPCLRYKISETALFDKGRHPQYIWSQRWKEMKIVEIKEWQTSEVRTIELTQDIGNAVYKVNVRQFTPVEGDALERKWTTDGKAQSYKCSSWAIVNMKETGHQLMKYVEDQIKTSIEYFIGDTDELLRSTYDMAFEHSEKAAASTSTRYLSNKLIKVNEQRAEERRLLRCALKLWVAIRMESRSERICSEENLGMVPQQFDPAAPNFNQVLVPPVMSAQIELIMTAMVLLPLKKAVLTQLQELIKANRARSWFTIYLCLFVLLHSCALLTSFENMQAMKYGLQSRYVYAPFIEELHHGSKIMLAYFHYCNKGGYPFATDWTVERNVKQAELNPDQLRFLMKTAQLVEQKSALFKHIAKRSEFEHDFFFVSRLYNTTWQPF